MVSGFIVAYCIRLDNNLMENRIFATHGSKTQCLGLSHANSAGALIGLPAHFNYTVGSGYVIDPELDMEFWQIGFYGVGSSEG